MTSLLRAIAGAPFLARAQRQVGNARYDDAVRSLRALARVVGAEVPSKKLPLRANVIALQSAYFLSDRDLLRKALSVAIDQSVERSAKRGGDREAYIVKYLFGVCEFAGGKFPNDGPYFEKLANRISHCSMNYQAEYLPERLLLEMPLGA